MTKTTVATWKFPYRDPVRWLVFVLWWSATAVAAPLSPAQLLGAARELARRDRCDDVRAIGARVQRLDAAFYAERFLLDDEILRCDEPRVAIAPLPAPPRASYRPWLIAVDVAAMSGTLLATQHMSASVRTDAFLVAYLFASPLVHLVAGNPRSAIASLAARASLPVALGTFGAALGGLGSAIYRGPYAFIPNLEAAGYGSIVGAWIGVGAAYLVDWTVLPTFTPNSIGVAFAF